MNLRLFHRRTILFFCLAVLIAIMFSVAGCGGKNKELAYGPGSGWIDDMREQIADNIDDPQKVTELLVVIDKIDLSLVELDGEVKNYYVTLSKLDRNYNSTREDFQGAMDQFNAARLSNSEQLLGYMFEMKKIAGEDDWKKLADIDKTLYANWQRTYSF